MRKQLHQIGWFIGIWAASIAALQALSIATVATGTPFGICTIDSNES